MYADFGTDYYFIKGKAYNNSGALLKNEFLILKQGEYFRLFKTDNQGNYIVQVPFLLPCLTGFPAPKSKYDDKSVKMVEYQNGKKIEIIPLNGEGYFQVNDIWKKYYFGDSIDIKERIENVEIHFSNNKLFERIPFQNKHQEYIKDRTVLFNFFNRGNIKLPEIRHYLFESLLDFLECRNLTKEEVIELLGIPKESKVIQNFTNKLVILRVEKQLYSVQIITAELSLNNNIVTSSAIKQE